MNCEPFSCVVAVCICWKRVIWDKWIGSWERNVISECEEMFWSSCCGEQKKLSTHWKCMFVDVQRIYGENFSWICFLTFLMIESSHAFYFTHTWPCSVKFTQLRESLKMKTDTAFVDVAHLKTSKTTLPTHLHL